jgi:hypothetical protein
MIAQPRSSQSDLFTRYHRHRSRGCPEIVRPARSSSTWPEKRLAGSRPIGDNGLFTPLAAPADTKVSTTPSSNRFAFTLDGICVSHPIESDMRNGQCTTLELPGGTALGASDRTAQRRS